jgi:hypothetical protein
MVPAAAAGYGPSQEAHHGLLQHRAEVTSVDYVGMLLSVVEKTQQTLWMGWQLRMVTRATSRTPQQSKTEMIVV